VVDCCGLCAFTFETVYACNAMAEHGRHELEQCVIEIDTILTEIQAIPAAWSVSSKRLNAIWPKAEALTFFEMLKDLFQDALSIGPVPWDGPHPSYGLNQLIMRG